MCYFTFSRKRIVEGESSPHQRLKGNVSLNLEQVVEWLGLVSFLFPVKFLSKVTKVSVYTLRI